MTKQILSLLALSLGATVAFTGCATYESRPAPHHGSVHHSKKKHGDRDDRKDRHDKRQEKRHDDRRDDHGERGEWNRTPALGMTKGEVRKRYGEPISVDRGPRGEVWHYVARVRGRDFIPIYGAVTAQRKGGSIGFDSHGRVNSYEWGRDYRNAWWR